MTASNGEQPPGATGTARDIDPDRGHLGGVASGMAVEAHTRAGGADLAGPAPYEVWRDVPRTDGRDAWRGQVTYFDRPAIKQPVWIWSVPAYFYVGGVAGAAALLGAVAQNDDDLAGMVDRCRWMAALGTTVGTGLLIEDLGRPDRFLNMLRVLRPTSPMSVGSWILAATATLSSAAVAADLVRRRTDAGPWDGILRTAGRTTLAGAGLLGMPLAGYTAVLVANTAVPAWQAARRTLPPLFMSSSVLAAASALELTRLGRREATVVRAFGTAGAVGELILGKAVERETSRVERVGKPYHDGVSGALWKVAKAATAVGLVLRLLPAGGGRRRWLPGLLGTVGSLSLRFAVFHAGTASSRDPRATFQNQRNGCGGQESTGTAAIVGSGDRRATRAARGR